MDDANDLKPFQYNPNWFYSSRWYSSIDTGDQHCKNLLRNSLHSVNQPLCTVPVNAKSSFMTVETRSMCSPLGGTVWQLFIAPTRSVHLYVPTQFFSRSIYTWCFEDTGKNFRYDAHWLPSHYWWITIRSLTMGCFSLELFDLLVTLY